MEGYNKDGNWEETFVSPTVYPSLELAKRELDAIRQQHPESKGWYEKSFSFFTDTDNGVEGIRVSRTHFKITNQC